MDSDMIVGYDFMMETDSGVLPAQASMTLYQDDQLVWLSSPEHHVECQWIHPNAISSKWPRWTLSPLGQQTRSTA